MSEPLLNFDVVVKTRVGSVTYSNIGAISHLAAESRARDLFVWFRGSKSKITSIIATPAAPVEGPSFLELLLTHDR